MVMFEVGGVGVMRSSRHWGFRASELGRLRDITPVGVERVSGAEEEEGGTDWKAWMGRASKNSWAKMKGVLSGSARKINRLFRGKSEEEKGVYH